MLGVIYQVFLFNVTLFGVYSTIRFWVDNTYKEKDMRWPSLNEYVTKVKTFDFPIWLALMLSSIFVALMYESETVAALNSMNFDSIQFFNVLAGVVMGALGGFALGMRTSRPLSTPNKTLKGTI